MLTYMRNKIILLTLLFFPLIVSGVTIENPISYGTLGEVVSALVNFVLLVSIPLTAILFIIAGFYYLTAGANPENVKKAKNLIVWTIIGLAIILVSGGISTLIKNILEL